MTFRTAFFKEGGAGLLPSNRDPAAEDRQTRIATMTSSTVVTGVLKNISGRQIHG